MASSGSGMVSSLSPGFTSSPLPKLMQETELQKMLADEKIRSEQHRTNYQMLKAEHTRLQDEHMQLQHEMRRTIEEAKMMQDRYKTQIEMAQRETSAKVAEIEELKTQVVTPQRLEVIRMQIAEEVEGPYREKFTTLDSEVEGYRNQYNKLRYEFSFLKSEMEHEREEQKKLVEDMKLQHEAEVANLRKEREVILARQTTDTAGDAQRVRVVQRENSQLQLKIKGLLTELEEIRAQREHMGMQSDHVSRLQGKQLAEHSANIKALETEKQALRLQCENLQKELTSTSDLYTQMTSKIHQLERDNTVLKNKMEEVSHKAKVDLSNMRMELVRERGDLERERDGLLTKVEDLQAQIDVTKHSMEQQAAAILEKERECAKKVQSAREEEWERTNKLETERLELEAKLQEIERRKIDEEARRHADKERAEEQIKAAHGSQEAAEKECAVLRTKLQQYQSMEMQLEQERSQNSELKTKIHQLDTDYNSLLNSEQELSELVNKLQTQLSATASDLSKAREQVKRTEREGDKVLAQHRGAWADEKGELQKRVEELTRELEDTHTKLTQATAVQKKRKAQYSKLHTKLKNRLQLLEASLQEVQMERDVLNKNVPQEIHNRLKKQLKDLQRRHNEFRQVLISGTTTNVPIGNYTFASMSVPMDLSAPALSFVEQEKTHQRDLRLLKERLEQLEEEQVHQAQALAERVSIHKGPIFSSTLREVESENSDKENVDDT
ncbi:centrosomal protein of 83 kDa-like [Lingula anatina]|uniref:Centrosomal protein of 83 kDa-like n=1 Tax=Lingula anatina TaxID=7574 RepID=A0A1S3K008_LINAN|nr:centrosomal protein of 83 kDa-like [Lingula anatina]|eukprot:XP_013415985.1 centrosomal protein of 83 kDa-like [Lingula anatina]